MCGEGGEGVSKKVRLCPTQHSRCLVARLFSDLLLSIRTGFPTIFRMPSQPLQLQCEGHLRLWSKVVSKVVEETSLGGLYCTSTPRVGGGGGLSQMKMS